MKKIFLLLMAVVGLVSCGSDEIDKGSYSIGPIDQTIVGKWEYDHVEFSGQPATNPYTTMIFELYDNGVCSYKVSNYMSGYWTAQNGLLKMEMRPSNGHSGQATQDTYYYFNYRLEQGLLVLNQADDPNPDVLYLKRKAE